MAYENADDPLAAARAIRNWMIGGLVFWAVIIGCYSCAMYRSLDQQSCGEYDRHSVNCVGIK